MISADLMRFIDRWVGIPCCFLLTMIDWIRRLTGTRCDKGHPKRILFIGMAELGGLVVAHPAIKQAKSRFSDAEIYFLTFSGGRDMLKLMGIDSDHQVIIRPKGFVQFFGDTVRAILLMRRLGIDATVNLEAYARFSSILAYLSGAVRRAGFDRFHEEGQYLGSLITHKAVYSPHIHAARSFITLLETLVDNPKTSPLVKRSLDDIPLEPLRLISTPERQMAISARLVEAYPALQPTHRRIILNANASDLVAVRRWLDDNWVELARRLLINPENVIILTGAPDEVAHSQRFAATLNHERVINMAGQTTLEELIDLYNASDLLITNDSGPGHFASTADIDVIVLFGPETPRIYGPLGDRIDAIYLDLACSPCVSVYNHKRSPCEDNLCLKLIGVDDVHQRALRCLAR